MNGPIRGLWHDDPAHFRRPSRRDFLYVGMVGGLGVTLGDVLRQEARASQKFYSTKEGRAKNVIHIFLPGGIASQESFDPKVHSPVEYRGPFGSVATKIPGERFSELFPKTAGIADKVTVVRTMSHGEAAHERGTHNMFTGYRPSPALRYPSIGSVVAHEMGPRKNLPPYVAIPNQPNEWAGSGYLSTAYGPFSLGADPASGNFTVRDLNLPSGVDESRFNRRRNLLSIVDSHFKEQEDADAIAAMDSFYQRAYGLISSPEAREAFNLSAEPEEVKNAYGKNEAGMRFLMARRLVEAGVRFASVVYGAWDHHDNIQRNMSSRVPPLDQAYAALITDLEQRGLLEDTLVMLTTEFGRTPRINGTAGRDHWPKVFSIVLAGGGIRKGYVHGKSDMTSTDIDEGELTLADWAHTMYHLMGIDAEKDLMAPGDRPIKIVDGGEVMRELLA